MKTLLLIPLFLLLISCGGTIEDPDPIPYPKQNHVIIPHSYCGDNICDSNWGEDEWWCIDCGYDPKIDGPKDGGYCGDGVCFGYETQRNCYKDCSPVPWHIPERDPGWIDPIRR